MEDSITLILPTYNEVQNITPLIERIVHEMEGLNYDILVVDDNSPDGTADVVRDARARFSRLSVLVRHSDKGLVPSIQDGLRVARGNICIWMDADLSMSPIVIKDILRELDKGADLVVGSRYIEGGGMKGTKINGDQTPLFKIIKTLNVSEDSIVSALISKFGNRLLKSILGLSLCDYSSGFFGAKRELFETVKLEGGIVDYCIRLPYHTVERGFRVVEVPMILDTRKYGKSKTGDSLLSIFKIACQCVTTAFRLRIGSRQ